MIKKTIKTSGKKGLEIKQRILFPHKKGPVEYHVETWLFFPSNLLINRWTYSPQLFQQSLKNYIRLRPPSLMLEEFAGVSQAMLAEIALLFSAAADDEKKFSAYEDKLRIFCLTYKRALNLGVRAIRSLSEDDRGSAAASFAQTAADVLAAYRTAMQRVKEKDQGKRARAFTYCDEFLAFTTTQYSSTLLNYILPGENALRDFWRDQTHYQKAFYPGTIPVAGSDNELVVYRVNLLKKYVSSPMYLDVHRKRGETFLSHTIAGIAAALSMVFATAVAFLWQGKYGALSTQLFLALVIGYIFKDRMKEIFRQRLFSTFRRWLPDRRQMIYKNTRKPIGKCDESFVFIDEDQLPEDVNELRKNIHLFDIQNAYLIEKVLHYSKHVKLWDTENLFTGVNRSVMDITRLDISFFLTHMDESLSELPMLEDESVTYGEKVYHINMIRRVTDAEGSELERTRIVVNRAGIKRIEPIYPLITQNNAYTNDNLNEEHVQEQEFPSEF